YWRLTNGLVPARRHGWLVVQVPRTPELFRTDQLTPLLVNVVHRARRRWYHDGLTVRLLEYNELLDAVAVAANVDRLRVGRAAGGGSLGPLTGRETWRCWLAGHLAQASFRVTRWPTRPWSLDQLLLGLPASAVTLSAAMVRDHEQHGRGV